MVVVESKKILVIEDDPDIRMILKGQLEMDGYEVYDAETGSDGITLLKEITPDVVVLDLNLPDTDGLKVCKEIKDLGDIPVIMLTVRDTMSDKLRGFEAGADDYVTKPFEYLELAARIKVALKRKGQRLFRDEPLEKGDVRLFHRRREVIIGDKVVRLTKKECELLELLMIHEGDVVPREFIKSQIWQGKVPSESRSLDVHVRRLRCKIEPDPDKPRFVITHPGVGYRFEAAKVGEQS